MKWAFTQVKGVWFCSATLVTIRKGLHIAKQMQSDLDNQMYIVNGRTLGDLAGKFTCHTPRGSSVIDYFISSRSLSNTIFNMYVHDVSLFF